MGNGFQPPEPYTAGARKRKAKHVSPRALDYMLNGVPVYIRRRPADQVAYATTYDFSKFVMEEPLQVVRKKFNNLDEIRAYKPDEDPVILKLLAEYNKDTIKDIL